MTEGEAHGAPYLVDENDGVDSDANPAQTSETTPVRDVEPGPNRDQNHAMHARHDVKTGLVHGREARKIKVTS